MSIKILKDYIQICEDIGVQPTWKGIKKFKEDIYGEYSLCK